jgi:hypothetical protein
VQLDNLGWLSVLVELFRGLAVGIKDEGLEGHLALGEDVDLVAGHGGHGQLVRGLHKSSS